MSIPNDRRPDARARTPAAGQPDTAANVRTVAIIGASRDRTKYGNKSVRAHRQVGYRVFPINPHADEIEGLAAYRSLAEVPVESLDRISMYVPPHVGIQLLPDIAAKGCRELWLNPGSESDELLERARSFGLEPIVACSIVELGMSPMQFGT